MNRRLCFDLGKVCSLVVTYRAPSRHYIPVKMEDYYYMLIPICFWIILALLHKFRALMNGLSIVKSLVQSRSLSFYSGLAISILCRCKSYHIAKIFISCAWMPSFSFQYFVWESS